MGVVTSDLVLTERLVSRIKAFEQMSDAEPDGKLRSTLAVIANRLPNLVMVPITQGQFEALVDYGYSCGLDALKESSLLRHLNEGNLGEAVETFRHWKPPQGGLTQEQHRRRMEERAWFLGVL